ncbi:hypothetical protein BCR44DRAFT_1370196, partial [Catenaria anguillulae PL171]
MLEDPSNDQLIAWLPEGDGFVIVSPTDFSRRLLPVVYKHSNLASFVRQVNM